MSSNHYVDNKKFYAELKVYVEEVREAKKRDKPKPPPTDYLADCVYEIARNLAKRPNFAVYDAAQVEDMIMDGVENCLRYMASFKPEESNNPFGYFTQVCWNAFIRNISKEKKQQDIKYAALRAADQRGDFTQWARKKGIEDEKGGDVYAKYLGITSEDLERIEKSDKEIKQKERKKQNKKNKSADPIDTLDCILTNPETEEYGEDSNSG